MHFLFFSMFTGIHEHSTAEKAILNALKSSGHTTEALTCGKLLWGQCITLSAHGLAGSSERQSIEKTCQKCSKMGESLFKDSHTLVSFHTKFIDQSVNEILSFITPDNFFTFNYHDIPLGKLSAYQHLLRLKKSSLNIAHNEWPVFLKELENCTKTLLILEKIFSIKKLPDAVFIYNTLYSVNAVAKLFFEKRNIPVYSLHAGPNLFHFYDTLITPKQHAFHWTSENRKLFAEHAQTPLNLQQVDFVLDHFKALVSAQSAFAYSSSPDHTLSNPREYFKIKKDQRIVLIALSSGDENFAGLACGAFFFEDDFVFKTQLEWLDHVIAFAKTRSDLFFIFRIHPRELPNKRERLRSEQSFLIFDRLKQLPPNCALNTPEDRYSILQLIGFSNLLLTAWSSSGLEATVLGCPVLAYTKNWLDYPYNLVHVADTKTQYFEMLSNLVQQPWNLDRSIQAFRWYSLIQDKNCLHLKPSISWLKNPKVKQFVFRVFYRFWPKFLPLIFSKNLQDSKKFLAMIANLDENPIRYTQVHESSKPAEKHAVISGLSKIGEMIFGSRDKWPQNFTNILKY